MPSKTIILLLLTVRLLWSQTSPSKFHYETALSRSTISQQGVLESAESDAVEYKSLLARLGSGISDPRAATLIDKSEELTRDVLYKLPSLRRLDSVTWIGSDGDTFVVRWSFAEPFGKGTVVLYDTPLITKFYFEMPATLEAQEDLDMLLTGLIVLGRPPLNLSPKVSLFSTSTGITRFDAEVLYSERAADGSLTLSGNYRAGRLLMTIRPPKLHATSLAYGMLPGIPERFPFLAELATQWSIEKLMRELGKPPDSPYTGNRAFVLLTELVRRGLNEDDILALFISAPVDSLAERAGMIVRAYSVVGVDFDLSRLLPRIATAYEAIGPRATSAAEGVFRIASGRCNERAEAAALAMIEHQSFEKAGLRYLGICSSSPEVAAMISRVHLPTELERFRGVWLKGIRDRISQGDHKK